MRGLERGCTPEPVAGALMATLWVLTCLLITLWHIVELPSIINLIIRSALLAGSGGWRGWLHREPLIPAAFSAACFQRSRYGLNAECRRQLPHHSHCTPAAQGIVQMIGVLIDTIVICSASAMVVLLAGHGTKTTSCDGIQFHPARHERAGWRMGRQLCRRGDDLVRLHLHRGNHPRREQLDLFTLG